MNKRLDEKATAEQLQSHIEVFKQSDRDAKDAIKELREKHERTIVDLNNRHEQNVRDLRQEINGMSDRMDKRFDQILSMLQKNWRDE